jgi:hypothetical protein
MVNYNKHIIKNVVSDLSKELGYISQNPYLITY